MSLRILAIDTSTAHGHVAFLVGEQVVFEKRFVSQRSHNSQIFAPLKEALTAADSQIDVILVGTGPGSYTGVRIGISAAQGMALTLGAKVFGMSSAMGVPSLNATFCGDARRGHFYMVPLDPKGWPDKVDLLSKEAFAEKVTTAANSELFTFDRTPPCGFTHIKVLEPSAVVLAKRFLSGVGAPVEDLETRPLEPIYLSEAFITQAKPKNL